MKQHVKTLMMIPALLAAGLTQAQISANVTLVAGGRPTGAFGVSMVLPPSSGTLAFSDDLIGALAVAGIQTTIIGPATGTVSDTAISITAPIQSLSGTLTADVPGSNGVFTATQVATLGGAMMVAPKANFATTGGSLAVTGIQVDLTSQGIYATVSGANGLATQTVRVWDYAAIVGNTTAESSDFRWINDMEVEPRFQNHITGLTITDEAFELFAQGLGLKAGGIAAMASIADYGVMTATIPEASTYLMMGLGLVGLSLVARRAQHKAT